MYVYIETVNGHFRNWAVRFYRHDPSSKAGSSPVFTTESVWPDPHAAARRVHWLNGGNESGMVAVHFFEGERVG